MDAPKSTLPYPPIHDKSKVVVLSDCVLPKVSTDSKGYLLPRDGTITMMDTNDYLTDNLGFGFEKRRALNLEVLAGRMTFRDAFREMLESINLPLDECIEILKKNIKIDPTFKEFYAWCKNHDVPLVIVSSGMEPIIRAVFESTVGGDSRDVDIICNSVKVNQNGKFEILFRHPESGYGHDKSQAILPYRELSHKPILFFFGDGVSDLSAAQHADILYAKDKPDGENDLAAYCTNMGIKHLTFKEFSEVLPVLASVVEGKATVEEVLKASPI